MHDRLEQAAVFLVIGLSFVSVLFTCTLVSLVVPEAKPAVRIALPLSVPSSIHNSHTFIGDDYPEFLPLELTNVAMVVEESAHYSLTDPEAGIEWLYTSPPGTGSVRFGAENRTFFVSMFHELHCLRGFRHHFLGGKHSDKAHLQHCFNYLRQQILCHADLTLEPGDFTTRNFSENRIGATHTCQDWEAIYDYLTVNWDDWMIWKLNQEEADSNHNMVT